MQDRIKDLAVESGAQSMGGGLFYMRIDSLERFALAVARECCQVVDVHPYWLGPTAKRELTDAIRARFGLGE